MNLMQILVFLPESYAVSAALAFLVACAMPPRQEGMLRKVAICLSLLCVAASICALGADAWLFYGTYRVDFFSQFFKLLLAVSFFLVCVISEPLGGVDKRHQPEYYLLLSTATLGMMMLMSARELLTLYISLELASYSLYILVALRKGESINIEAAIKYLLIGAASSAVLLFGFSFIFGLAHTTNMELIMRRMPDLIRHPTMLLGIVLFACGLFFKMSVFPFHFWAPDVYQGGANHVAAFIATSSKLAAAAILLRFFSLTVQAHHITLQNILIFLAIVTMTLGNLAAIVQTDMKRMLAYSSISQAGYILVGLLTLGHSGFAAAIFYAPAYMVMTFAAFMILTRLEVDGGDVPITGFAGLYKRAPLLALTLMVALLSLGGVPPFVGFTGKWFLFSAAMERHLWWLVLIGVINSTISVYYYLMVIKQAYLREPAPEAAPLPVSFTIQALCVACILFILIFGVAPARLLEVARMAASYLI